MPTGFERDFRSELEGVRPISDSMSESVSEPEMLDTFPTWINNQFLFNP